MAESRRGLGRGLGALIDAGGGESHPRFAEVPLADIEPNPHQPRAKVERDGLGSLVDSIRAVGVLQPVVVRPLESNRFQLVAGERRWRAAQAVGLATIPAVIRAEEGWDGLSQALVENLVREDLNPLEEAAAFRQLIEDFGMSHEEVGVRVGRSRPAITNALRLLSLPGEVQRLLEKGELSGGHAKVLAALDDRAYAIHLANRCAKEKWSVRMLEDAVRLRSGDAKRAVRRLERPAEILSLEEKLGEQLGAKVAITYRPGAGGSMRVRFSSLDDLERIYRQLFGS